MAHPLFKGTVTVTPTFSPGSSMVAFTIEKQPEETVKIFAVPSNPETGALTRQDAHPSVWCDRSVHAQFSLWKYAFLIQVECISLEAPDTIMSTVFVVAAGVVYDLTDQEWISLEGVQRLCSSLPLAEGEREG